MNVGVVLSGGNGSRFGSAIPKQYLKICGREVISYSIDALKKSGVIDAVIAVAQGDYIKYLADTYGVEAVEGGATRNGSIKKALDYAAMNYEVDKIVILEAARPMVTSRYVSDYINLLDQYDTVITAQKIVDSIGSYHTHCLDRNDYYLIQAPEAFKFPMFYDNFKADSSLTATNQQMPLGYKLYINFDFNNNIKITYQPDLKYCEALLTERNDEI